MLGLLGLQDDYTHDGRVLVEVLHDRAVPQTLLTHRQTLIQLAQVYKQINAPFGELGKNSLIISTAALESDSAGDATCMELENLIAAWTNQRDGLTVLLILVHQRRRVVHCNVTEHPSARWTALQVVEAFARDEAPRYLLRDRDRIYGMHFR
jgi:hypothetical protein